MNGVVFRARYKCTVHVLTLNRHFVCGVDGEQGFPVEVVAPKFPIEPPVLGLSTERTKALMGDYDKY